MANYLGFSANEEDYCRHRSVMMHYFDNCATTMVDQNIVDLLNKYHTEKYFNPSARSTYSLEIANDITSAREKISKILGAQNYNVYFTSGGTESDNLGIFGSVKNRRGNIVATMSEHSAVYNSLLELQNRGFELRLANVTEDGHIDIKDFLTKVDKDTLIACFMHVNNETGAVNDIKRLAKGVKSINNNTVCFSDGVQAVGKIPINLGDLDVDVYTFSGHKLHCTKGIGALLIKKNLHLNSIVFGGGQERGIRSGTEYVGGIIALANSLETAVSLISQNRESFLQYKQIIRDRLEEVPEWRENCCEDCSPAIMSLAFADIKGEVLLHMLESSELVLGTGSACSSKNKHSRIAQAINLPSKYVEGILRISFSKYNNADEAKLLGEELKKNVLLLRKTMLG